MPHVNIKHFPSLTKDQQSVLSEKITNAITEVIGCEEGVVSIALEPIEKENWNEQVYQPEIVNRKKWLHKQPNY